MSCQDTTPLDAGLLPRRHLAGADGGGFTAPFRYRWLVDVVPAGASRPRRAELLAALSLAIDLGLGQPLEHMLRSCLIAMGLADLVGADALERDTAYYGGLLAWIGCHADSQEYAELFGERHRVPCGDLRGRLAGGAICIAAPAACGQRPPAPGPHHPARVVRGARPCSDE